MPLVKVPALAMTCLFHTLRHTWASQAAMAGLPLLFVAQNLGHLKRGRAHTGQVEATYGHLCTSFTTQRHAEPCSEVWHYRPEASRIGQSAVATRVKICDEALDPVSGALLLLRLVYVDARYGAHVASRNRQRWNEGNTNGKHQIESDPPMPQTQRESPTSELDSY